MNGRRFGLALGCLLVGISLVLGLGLQEEGTASQQAVTSEVRVQGVPHVRQRPDFCGEACAEMVLRHLRTDWTQDDVFAMTGISPGLGRGARAPELARALRGIGFKVGPVWQRVRVAHLKADMEEQWRRMVRDLTDGVPSIVCMRYDESPDTTEHFRLVVGYDPVADEVLYHEPAVDMGAWRRMARTRFLSLWPLRYDTDRWTVIRMAMRARKIKQRPPRTIPSPADQAQHRIELEKQVPAGFTVLWEPPFFVIGDESPDRVRERSRRTVRWTVRQLKRWYFDKDPEDIIDIWLFRNEASYRSHAKKLFGHEPSTPYGYYSPSYKALVMNIATGGGTLVHEIVHPFVRANIPDCPAWLNEGLGSLYEQCGEREGRITGFTNWRLAGLQRAIRDGDVPPFKATMSTTDHEFYDEDPGTNYAQSRYLLYYLQERNQLLPFFRAFMKNRDRDPAGYETLESFVGKVPAFQRTWEKWVLTLHYP